MYKQQFTRLSAALAPDNANCRTHDARRSVGGWLWSDLRAKILMRRMQLADSQHSAAFDSRECACAVFMTQERSALPVEYVNNRVYNLIRRTTRDETVEFPFAMRTIT